MIRALLKKQLLELCAAFVRSSKTGKRRSRVGTFGYTLLFTVLMLLVMLSFGSMALPLAVTLVPQGLAWLYFVLMELSALTVSVLASAFTSYGHLFRCRDNQQLLALPIPPGAIFAVRCGGVYLTGLIYLLLAWVPSVVCYALAAPCPGGALLAALPVALALAGVSMVLAVLLGWAVALLNRRARHKSLVTVVGTLLFLAVYYAVFQWVGNAVDALALDAVQAGASASRAAAPLRLLGLAAVGNVPALLLLLAAAAACMALCGKALAKPYLRLLTLEPGRTKAEYRAKTKKAAPAPGIAAAGTAASGRLPHVAAQLRTEQSAVAGAGRSGVVEGRRPARLYCCLPAGEPAHAGVWDGVHHSRHELYHRAVGVAGR